MRIHVGLALGIVGIAALAACGSGESSSPEGGSESAATAESSAGQNDSNDTAVSRSDCGAGEIDGVTVRTFCGDGTATLSDGTTTLELDQAECAVDPMGWSVNAGTIVLDPSATEVAASTQYIGFAVPPPDGGEWTGDTIPDGTYQGIVTGNDQGKDLTASAADATIVVTDGGKAGTVSGTSFEGASLTGSFSCE
ncbi:MAG: hypothetical protein KDC23_05355 [Actinobacteria bacterium]|nr:hypothetical protein [Actinomycetota bacterium]